MNKPLPVFFASLLAIFGFAACGGSGGGEPDHPPAISNLRFSPASALQAPDGTVTISGTFDFADAGGDIASLRLASNAGDDLTVPTPSLAGRKSGTGTGSFIVSVDKIGKFSFELWATDSRGSSSNRLVGTFEVVPDETASTWTQLAVMPPDVLYGIAWNGSQYVAVGARGTVMTSPDLKTWTARSAGVDHTFRSIATSGARFVAVGHNDRGEAIVISSTDGATWTVQYRAGGLNPVNLLTKVIWAGTQFVAVGQELETTISPPNPRFALILTSPDGVSWTQRARRQVAVGDGADPESGMSSIAWSGNLLVAVGITNFAAAWTSTDAEVWTRQSVSASGRQYLRDITWGNGRFVAVGWGGAPAVFTSADGITWQGNSGSEPLPAMNAVTTAVNRYLAVSNTHRETSADGLAWSSAPSQDCGNGVLWDGTRYVSVGSSICRSP